MKTKIAIFIVAVIALGFLVLHHAPPAGSKTAAAEPSPRSEPRVVPLPSARSATATSPSEALWTSRPPAQVLIATEVMYSTDLRATYEKHKSDPDPTGEVSYFLSKALDECASYIRKTPQQISASMNATGKPIAVADREKLISKLVDRCKGFSDWDERTRQAYYEELMKKAAAANYPAAVARGLGTILVQDGMQKADATAMSLLSGSVDDGVINGVYQYLIARNGNEWFLSQGDGAAVEAAWLLLECNMGGDCGAMSRPVITACLYYGVCGQYDVASALPMVYPGLTPVQLQSAIALETTLGNAIRDRDWVRLGFSYVRKSPDSGPG